MTTITRHQVIGLTAKAFLQELLVIQKERPDFDELPIYVEVIDQGSYDLEQSEPDDEYTETVEGAGVVYMITVAEGFSFKGKKQVSTGHYLLIRAVDDEEGE